MLTDRTAVDTSHVPAYGTSRIPGRQPPIRSRATSWHGGLAGGRWEKIEPLIRKELVAAGVDVTVYDFASPLPNLGE